jgi:predicted transcriptional regulator/transcriptional regulator with XRE-family HTH domain
MPNQTVLGAKLRAFRKRQGLTQSELAQRLEISASYLNLIENNRRPLTAPLLLKLAQTFDFDLASFTPADDARLTSEVREAFGDPLFETHGLSASDIAEFTTASPQVSRAVLSLYRAYVSSRDSARALAGRGSGEGVLAGPEGELSPSEEVSDMMQGALNYFPLLEEGAAALWKEARLDPEDVQRGLIDHLSSRHGIRVEVMRVGEDREAMRRFDQGGRVLRISEVLPPWSRRFQIAHQIGLLTQSERIEACLADKNLSREARALARVALANYFAAALLMPYDAFLAGAKALRYDVELLGYRFGTSFEQVCHRLTTLHAPRAEGVPFHFLRIDLAGNISKRFSASGIQIARFAGACPRWNVHHAFQTPGMICKQVSRMPDGKVYFCVARTLQATHAGHGVPQAVQAVGLGCEVRYARELVYSDGVDLENLDAAVPVGVTCRLCEHMGCTQRAFPSLLHPIQVQENVRGVSFYAPVGPR